MASKTSFTGRAPRHICRPTCPGAYCSSSQGQSHRTYGSLWGSMFTSPFLFPNHPFLLGSCPGIPTRNIVICGPFPSPASHSSLYPLAIPPIPSHQPITILHLIYSNSFLTEISLQSTFQPIIICLKPIHARSTHCALGSTDKKLVLLWACSQWL